MVGERVKMNNERYFEAEKEGKVTQEEFEQGWHFCIEWDDMLIGPGTEEALMCYCNHPKIEEWKQSDEAKEMYRQLEENSDAMFDLLDPEGQLEDLPEDGHDIEE
jgi:hypothetical protein